jgi:hypothetical protein
MKKQFQILSFAITIIFYSCGKHNAEIPGMTTTSVKELSINSFSLINEPDLLLIDTEGRLRFNADPVDHANELQYSHSVRSGFYAIDRRDITKTIIRLNEPFGVN